jgi:hypothetical protein
LETNVYSRVNHPNDSGFWEWDNQKNLWVETRYEKKINTKNAYQILVAGYPRSGTTFFSFAIKEMYKSGDNNFLEKHTTEYINLNLDKNVCVVIRNPLQAIASWNHFRNQLKINTDLGLDADFNFYMRYYSFVDKVTDKIALLDFAKFSKDSKYIVDKVQNRFGIEPLVKLDTEYLKSNMITRGGANHLPRKPSQIRNKIEDSVANHPMYKNVMDLYCYLISLEQNTKT